MNTHNTIEKMTAMRMKGMADIYHQAVSQHLYSEMGQDEFTALMIDHEWEDRQHRKIQRLMANAGFQEQASASDLDFKDGRKLDRSLIERLLSLRFISHRENIIITGPTGVGKSYLAQANRCTRLSDAP
jgi:DNA replication protein DnaC